MNEMGGVRSTYGGEEEVHTWVWRENMKKKDQMEDLCMDGKITLKWILNK
jgi:hypothetical protein